MPSPVGHALGGLAAGWLLQPRLPQVRPLASAENLLFLTVAIAPDLDLLIGVHPGATHRWLTNRATLIARTETARTASVLVQARAEHIGVTHYQWQAVMDARTRASHAKLDGKVFAWAVAPLSDPPDHYAHPGQIWNCRCVALPILPGEA